MNAIKFSEWFLSANPTALAVNRMLNENNNPKEYKYLMKIIKDGFNSIVFTPRTREPSVQAYLFNHETADFKGPLLDVYNNIFADKDNSYIHSKIFRDKFEDFVDTQWKLLYEARNKKMEKEKNKKAKDKEFESTRIGVKYDRKNKLIPRTLKVNEKKFLSSTLPKIPTDIMDNIFSFLEPPKPTKISF